MQTPLQQDQRWRTKFAMFVSAIKAHCIYIQLMQQRPSQILLFTVVLSKEQIFLRPKKDATPPLNTQSIVFNFHLLTNYVITYLFFGNLTGVSITISPLFQVWFCFHISVVKKQFAPNEFDPNSSLIFCSQRTIYVAKCRRIMNYLYRGIKIIGAFLPKRMM